MSIDNGPSLSEIGQTQPSQVDNRIEIRAPQFANIASIRRSEGKDIDPNTLLNIKETLHTYLPDTVGKITTWLGLSPSILLETNPKNDMYHLKNHRTNRTIKMYEYEPRAVIHCNDTQTAVTLDDLVVMSIVRGKLDGTRVSQASSVLELAYEIIKASHWENISNKNLEQIAEFEKLAESADKADGYEIGSSLRYFSPLRILSHNLASQDTEAWCQQEICKMTGINKIVWKASFQMWKHMYASHIQAAMIQYGGMAFNTDGTINDLVEKNLKAFSFFNDTERVMKLLNLTSIDKIDPPFNESDASS